MQTLVVFSHLRWNCVVQRPQQLLSRLGQRWRVIFIEEPLPGAAHNVLEVLDSAPGVQVWRAHVTGDAPGFHDDHLLVLQKLVTDAMCEHEVADYWIWYYTPMALPLGSCLKPRGVVYDCMDELAAFKHASRQMVQRENALFKIADLVFAGGRSLYNAKRSRHPEVHCFPGSVDAMHFANAKGEHPLNADIPGPRLGYCGVIDERINLDLIDSIAKARPEWNIVMVGPTVQLDRATLPRRDNIHWLGPQSYDTLPAFISGWDIGLLPFALTDATRYISPITTLEYMACGRPCVSTTIRDVVEPYGHVVRVADTPEGFVADCEMLMQRPAGEKAAHARQLADIAGSTSWDDTVQAMAVLIEQADELVEGISRPAAAQSRQAESVPFDLANAAHALTRAAPADSARAAAAG